MIVFESCGGLGNQMFQYAAARALAVRLGVEVAADTAWYERGEMANPVAELWAGRITL